MLNKSKTQETKARYVLDYLISFKKSRVFFGNIWVDWDYITNSKLDTHVDVMFAMKHEMHKNHGIFKDINKLLKQEKKIQQKRYKEKKSWNY